ncbi:MAG TPA: FtsQ-type POTRA domain-containing protein [Candidatus Dormibacteraeota bacterium]
MSFRRRSSLLPRAPWPRGVERTEPLRGQLWTRSEKALREPDVAWGWRALAILGAGVEAALLVWLWFGPALEVSSVQVIGAHHLTAAEVARVAGVSSSSSVISVDGKAAHDHLLNQVWVRAATVQPQLPGSVVIQVSEWEPVAAYHAGPSKNLFWLSSQGVVLGAAGSADGLVDLQGPAGNDPHAGDRPLDPQLVTAVVNIRNAMPTLVGQDVSGFIFDSCGDLTMIAKRGWKVYFGRVLTPEQFASLHDKLAALKAISGKGLVDYSSSDLLYVNVMNPSEPAVGYRSRQPVAPSPSPGATPRPSPSPSPNPCK